MSLRGLILFAHGARDPAWARPFEAVAAAVTAQQPALELRLAFLEFMSPDLMRAAEQLVGAGCTQVQVLPLFLGTGGHVRRDLPEMVERLASTHPQVQWSMLPAVGEHASVVQAMAGVALHALQLPGAQGTP
ncbi:MAG: CbiX/SirB N-terminal domain-containing protein [Rubrivivax sp.]